MSHTILRNLLNLSLVLLAGAPFASAQTSTSFTFQGRLEDGGRPATGLYDLTFRVFASPDQNNPVSAPASSAAQPVTNGLFSVLLDFGSGPFNGEPRWMEISVKANGTGTPAPVTLSPRTPLTPTPYAIYAQSAGSVTNGAINSGQIANGTVVRSLNGLKDDVVLKEGNNITFSSVGNMLEISANGGGNGWALNGNTGTTPGVNFIGTTDGKPLELRSSFTGINRSSQITAAEYFGVRTPADNGYGGMYIETAGIGLPFYGYAMRGEALAWHYLDGHDGNKWKLSVGGDHLTVTPAGKVGIGTTAPTTTLDVAGTVRATIFEGDGSRLTGIGGGWNLTGNSGTGPANFLGTTDSQPLEFRVNNSRLLKLDSGGNMIGGLDYNRVFDGVVGGTISGGGEFYITYVPGPGGRLYEQKVPNPNIVTGNLGTIGGGSGNKAGVYATVPGGWNNSASGDFSLAAGNYANANHAGAFVWNSSNDYFTSTGENQFLVNASGGVGIGTANPKGALHVNGDYYGLGHLYLHAYEGDGNSGTAYVQARDKSGSSSIDLQFRTQRNGVIVDTLRLGSDGVTTVKVLTITGGADLAEPFPMSSAEIPKGALVIIDEENPGKLKLSERAQDTRVAGIVSGANGIKPGISLHQEGALEGGENVALSGRVYALADASSSPIKPGDLLTSSDTPGHCMKVSDPAKAQGAIIGKAMSALASGKGMVLVLVSLQ